MQQPKRLVYIAGPFRGKTAWDVRRNVDRAERAVMAIAETDEGLFPVCVHAMGESFDRTMTDEYWLDGTLLVLSRCDAMFVVPAPDLVKSAGTMGEIEYAKANEIPVFYNLGQLRAWANREIG